MRIDSHHHFWQYSSEQYPWISDDMPVLKRNFGPEDIQQVIEPAEVTGVISVQARQSIEETEWLVELARQTRFVRGVVGWLPLASEEIGELLEIWGYCDELKSVRHVIQDEPNDDFILCESFNEGVEKLCDYQLAYDILIFARHLPQTIQFVDRHHHQVFILDHIAKPTIRQSEFDHAWETNLRALAQRENVFCKFSGVVTEVRDASWDFELIRPYWNVALDAFGADRLMFGSDWPVCLLRTKYCQWLEAVEALAAELSPSEQAAFWSGNARRAYGLDAQ